MNRVAGTRTLALMSARPGSAAPWVLPAVAVLGVLGVVGGGVLVLAQRGALLVHQCISDGAAGWLGLRLALLRHDAACPSGSLAVGPDSRQALAVVIMVAAPLLIAHVMAVTVGLGLARRVGQIVRIAIRLLLRPFRPAPVAASVVVRFARRFATSQAVRPPGPVDVAVPLRRGPPLQFA